MDKNPEVIETIERREWLEPFILELQVLSNKSFSAACNAAQGKRSNKYVDNSFLQGLYALHEVICDWTKFVSHKPSDYE